MTQHVPQLHTYVSWYDTARAYKSKVLEQKNYLHACVQLAWYQERCNTQAQGIIQEEQEKNLPIDWMKDQVLDVTQ